MDKLRIASANELNERLELDERTLTVWNENRLAKAELNQIYETLHLSNCRVCINTFVQNVH